MKDKKFRAWDKRKKEMIHKGFALISTSPTWSGSMLHGDEKVDKLINKYYAKKGDLFGGNYSLIDWSDFYGSNYLVIMEFTGKLSENKTEIFEGDIINCRESDDVNCRGREMKNCIVTWSEQMCCFYYCPKGNINMPHQILGYAQDIEILGNIHENPELLNILM
jgi:uncharacterized phage protein (TIGR01671 family)